MLKIITDIELKMRELDAMIKLQSEEIEKYRMDLIKIKEKLSETSR